MQGHENLCNSLLTVKLAGYVIYIYTVPPANKVLWGIPGICGVKNRMVRLYSCQSIYSILPILSEPFL